MNCNNKIYIYRTCTDLRADEDNNVITVYGIEVFEKGAATPLLSMRDIFTREAPATELAELCNRLELDPIHLSAVVEDALLPTR